MMTTTNKQDYTKMERAALELTIQEVSEEIRETENFYEPFEVAADIEDMRYALSKARYWIVLGNCESRWTTKTEIPELTNAARMIDDAMAAMLFDDITTAVRISLNVLEVLRGTEFSEENSEAEDDVYMAELTLTTQLREICKM